MICRILLWFAHILYWPVSAAPAMDAGASGNTLAIMPNIMTPSFIPDRYLRTGALLGSHWLPGRQRVQARYRLLANIYAGMTQRADAVVIVHPKSGGTWFRVMMSRVYQKKYGLDARRLVKSDEFQRARPELPRFVISNGHYSYEAAVGHVLDNQGLQNRHLIFMARHPCDVAVSWYIQFTQRISAAKRELILSQMKKPIDHRNISRWDFVMNPEIGLPALIEYHNDWARFVSRNNGLIVRYEDLRHAPETHLKKTMSHLGEHAGDDMIAEAVQFASFDNLRKLETQSYFKSAGMRMIKRDDPGTYKVRRGKVGGYRQDFTADQAQQMADMVRERIDPILNYGGDGVLDSGN